MTPETNPSAPNGLTPAMSLNDLTPVGASIDNANSTIWSSSAEVRAGGGYDVTMSRDRDKVHVEPSVIEDLFAT